MTGFLNLCCHIDFYCELVHSYSKLCFSRLLQFLQTSGKEKIMAVHEDSSAQKKKSSDALDEIPTFNVENMQNNTRIINYRFASYFIALPLFNEIINYDEQVAPPMLALLLRTKSYIFIERF